MKLHDSAIVKLTNTQIQQGAILQNLSKTQDTREGHMLNLCRHLQVPPPLPKPPNPTPTQEDIEMTPAEPSSDTNNSQSLSQASNSSHAA